MSSIRDAYFHSLPVPLTNVIMSLMFFIGFSAEIRAQPAEEYLSETLSNRLTMIRNIYQKGEIQEAIVGMKNLIQEVPLYLPAYGHLAEYQLSQGDRDAAIATLKQATQKAADPLKKSWRRKTRIVVSLFRSHTNYSLYQQTIRDIFAENYKTAKSKLEELLKLEPDHFEVLLRLGQCHLLTGELKKATLYLEKATKLNPDEPQAWIWLGRSRFLLGENKKAEKAFQNVTWDARASLETGVVWWSDVLLISRGKKAVLDFLEKQLEKNSAQVQVLVKLAEYRSSFFPKDNDAQWQARKELQLALSRFDDYMGKDRHARDDSPLGINTLNLDGLRTHIEELIKKMELKIQKTES